MTSLNINRLRNVPDEPDLFRNPEMKKKSGTWNVHKKLTRKSDVGRWPNTIKYIPIHFAISTQYCLSKVSFTTTSRYFEFALLWY